MNFYKIAQVDCKWPNLWSFFLFDRNLSRISCNKLFSSSRAAKKLLNAFFFEAWRWIFLKIAQVDCKWPNLWAFFYLIGICQESAAKRFVFFIKSPEKALKCVFRRNLSIHFSKNCAGRLEMAKSIGRCFYFVQIDQELREISTFSFPAPIFHENHTRPH